MENWEDVRIDPHQIPALLAGLSFLPPEKMEQIKQSVKEMKSDGMERNYIVKSILQSALDYIMYGN
jgi:hypothetical protein